MSLAIGVDLGGTKIEAVIAERDGTGLDVRVRRRVPTESALGYESIVERAASFIREIAKEGGLDLATVPIGMGMPGNLTRKGMVKNSNTTCLNGRPFRDDLVKALGRPIAFDNDANCFALAETKLGAARAHEGGVVFGVIMGTGVGAGVVIRGEVWSGTHGIAGEWGHHAIYPERGNACYCGQRGCLEAHAAGPAVERDYAHRAGVKRTLAEIAEREGADVHADAALEGLLDAFGRGLANVIDILDPSAIVLGGGVSNLDILYDQGIDRVRSYVLNDELLTPIVRHELGDSAGVLGAALMAR